MSGGAGRITIEDVEDSEIGALASAIVAMAEMIEPDLRLAAYGTAAIHFLMVDTPAEHRWAVLAEFVKGLRGGLKDAVAESQRKPH
jgi:hypothetical protein